MGDESESIEVAVEDLRTSYRRASTPTAEVESDDEVEEDDREVLQQMSRVEHELLDMADRQEKLEEPSVELKPIPITEQLPIHTPHAYPCSDTYKRLPAHPSKWPQAPLMLRPTPGAKMKIRGIRYADSLEYQSFPGVCAGCILPVNSGREKRGKSLVIDFESALFVGTLLMRVLGAPPLKQSDGSEAEQSETSYFDGKKRKFQVVVKGRFKQAGVPMSECVTGQDFERAAGKLPARILVNTFIKFVSALAPQLEVTLDGDSPRFLTPLVATAHTVIAKDHAPIMTPGGSNECGDDENLVNFSIYAGSRNMEDEVEEPSATDSTSVMQMVAASNSMAASHIPIKDHKAVTHRRNDRKKVFNNMKAHGERGPIFDTGKEYTFEFFQHMLLLNDPEDFKIDMGRVKVGLAKSLAGQPIKILAARQDRISTDLQPLWSFDIWHSALYPYAQAALKHENS
jgi:hypothetical protein